MDRLLLLLLLLPRSPLPSFHAKQPLNPSNCVTQRLGLLADSGGQVGIESQSRRTSPITSGSSTSLAPDPSPSNGRTRMIVSP